MTSRPKPWHRNRKIRTTPAGLVAVVLAAIAASIAPAAQADTGWRSAGTSNHPSIDTNQGLATTASGRLTVRGYTSIRPDLALAGWSHIGDHDIHDGHTYDAYENLAAGRKLYVVTDSAGRARSYFHRVRAGEKGNNSFATVSPSGTYVVSGEFGQQRRLLVFANPVGRPDGSTIRYIGQIRFDRVVGDIQSCDFVTERRLLCIDDDHAVKTLHAVDLTAPLGGAVTPARLTTELTLPLRGRSACAGDWESEGVDYDARRRVLRVAAIEPLPCGLNTVVFRFTRAATTAGAN
ncbi:hypothetical protein GII33_12035 [Gordonia pseudamarae]|jgi:hypothetical protein|uniref:Uncharacterized protein n=1 Tax=Gordonia pseudamarae TaxID=2831662 RepID=A0ABX6IJR8_9ACTN|nr:MULTISPECIES: hypothetical protein [Gordonia]MBD0023717.1 hypothetical protein [Gordonia sp. (in: high G+C Gram-positive bacteria)]QHN26580.1 hypothetical protein GII33_12035 [Gordonia pseudamarae]QHN35473.1 hypothetical protein GII31_11865 [Gordonia pseudamarae]